MKPPVKDRLVGLQLLNSMFANNELQVFSTCKRTIQQFQELSYEIGESGEPNPAKIEKESEYHLVAAARYMAVGVSKYDIAPTVAEFELTFEPKSDPRNRDSDEGRDWYYSW